jgi:hypothetical protein
LNSMINDNALVHQLLATKSKNLVDPRVYVTLNRIHWKIPGKQQVNILTALSVLEDLCKELQTER